MIPIPVYLRLWRLYASNQHLLEMYYFLYNDVSGEEAVFYKREFTHRIERRGKIRQELQDYLREQISLEKDSKSSKIIEICLPVISSLDYGLYDIFCKPDLDRCRNYEIKNIEMYYEFLYSDPGDDEITDMLLDQKSVIENSVFREI